jgi:adenylate kinase
MLNIVLFGPPGAGKGTQSKQLIDTFQLIHCSTGDLLRSEIANKTELGLRAQAIMERGELVPDEVVVGMIASMLDRNPSAKGFIFDGFPRTTAQATALDALLSERNSQISGMIALEVDNEELKNRLLERGKSSGRPDDANPDIIANRIRVYNEQTAPVKSFYAAQNKLMEVDGMGSIGEITARLEDAIHSLKG